MHHRQLQGKEKFRVGDPVDPRDLDCRVTHAQLYKALPHPSGLHWSKEVPRPACLASTQYIQSSYMIYMDKSH